MTVSPVAGMPATPEILVNVPRLITAYYTEVPDPSVSLQRVAFGTSGHRGSAFAKGFNEWHILAISQAICQYRKERHIDGPPFLGIDTHALSVPAFSSALDLTVVNGDVDPTFRFMTVDWDGRIRMDPSSRCAMQRVIGL